MAACDATSAFLRAIRDALVGLPLTVEEIRSRAWSSGTFSGARHNVTIRIGGPGAGAAADRFVANLDAADFTLRDHLLADIALISDERGGLHVRLKIEALTVEHHDEQPKRRRRVRDRNPYPPGIVVTAQGYESQPWLLLGFPSGHVVITNAAPPPAAVRLYRFRSEEQAEAAGALLLEHAQLSIDGETWFVPDVRAERDSNAAIARLVTWAEGLDAPIQARLCNLGPGFYCLAGKARARA